MGSLSTSNLPIATAITIGGITVWDVDIKGANYSLTGKSHEDREILVGYDDFAKLCNVLLQPAPIALGGQAYPQPFANPRAPWMRVNEIQFNKLVPTQTGLTQLFYTATDGSQQSLVAGNYVSATIHYSQLDYQAFDTGDLEYDFTFEQYPAPNSSIGYYAANTPVLQENLPPIELQILNLAYTKKQQLSIPVAAMASAAAAPVNSAAFPLYNGGQNLAVTFPAGTVKYLGSSTSYGNAGSGSPQWTIKHRFSYKWVGWNTAFQPNATTIAGMFVNCFFSDGTTPYPYAKSNLTVLL